ncbi:hypothetical protein KZ483_25530 [Paenibacillus sp. sptzw28]|uniref:hypothetical protein n=1 Tax=Paenibacillus sp. sptzw28 TaxID=715179 RepID=UPI001C6DFA6A|nr:hypothetical protein [Paenibacillus sp. sptzw28]QYR21049.1 hypothetical protein KZ483_25530 [Paenibacillus sp. sptzw28]
MVNAASSPRLYIGVDAILAPTLTPRPVSRFGNMRVIFGGLCLAALSYALFLPVGLDWSYAAKFPTMILTGIAFALTYGPLTIAATDGIAEEEQGLAGGLLIFWERNGYHMYGDPFKEQRYDFDEKGISPSFFMFVS